MLVCFHDYTSPASAIAVARLQRLADEGAPMAFEGLDTLGVDVALPPTLDLLVELERHRDAAAAIGLRLRRPRRQPPTLSAHVVGDIAERASLGASWRDAAYRGYWTDGADLADRAALVTLASTAGLDPDEVAAGLADARLRRDVRARMLARRREGVGGVPVLYVDGVLVSALMGEADLRALVALHA